MRRWFDSKIVKMITLFTILSRSIILMKCTVSVAVVLYEYSVCLGSVLPGKKKIIFLFVYVDIKSIECL